MKDIVKQVRAARRAGATELEVWQATERSIIDAATSQGWRPSERAAALAEWEMTIREVFSKPLRSTRKARGKSRA